jgi:hypothetical protein
MLETFAIKRVGGLGKSAVRVPEARDMNVLASGVLLIFLNQT